MLETVRHLESADFSPNQARALADVIEGRAVSREELRYELTRLKLQIGGLIVGSNVTVLTVVLAVMALTS